ncbi:SDR family NAD(P)-dependent oxidoreductase [Microbacterium sp. NPDC056569]|uniref:SDR family NAD(P)-dependent oxidoreductase n=1 Tax=Microbacterium sp. NPDC056569 TaxID=3345867 RepID=UPI00366C5675
MTRTCRGTTALITGASAGLGVEYANQLAARGADVVLVARREDRLRALAERLEAAHGITATAIALDLSRTDAAAAQVVGLTLRRLDRGDVPPSVVSGRANAFGAWAARMMPRRLTLAVSGRVLR